MIAVASDLHLYPQSAASRRQHYRPEDVARFGREVAEHAKAGHQVILAGDIVDATATGVSVEEIWAEHLNLWRCLAAARAILLPGNHDPMEGYRRAEEVLGPGPQIFRTITLADWYICHGDQFDPWLLGSAGRRLSETVQEWGRYLGAVWPAAEDYLAAALARIDGSASVRRRALAYAARRPDLRGVACGHTHRREESARYRNAGVYWRHGWLWL